MRGILKKDIDPEMRFMDIAAWRERKSCTNRGLNAAAISIDQIFREYDTDCLVMFRWSGSDILVRHRLRYDTTTM